jgi:hypothetical protein
VRDGVTYRISRWADGRHIFKRVAIHDRAAAPVAFVERVARLGLADFRFMFALCGLTIDAVYGDYELSPFDAASSPRLIVAGPPRAVHLARQVLPDAADGLGRHPEVRREHGLRDAEGDRGIRLEELEVPLLG